MTDILKQTLKAKDKYASVFYCNGISIIHHKVRLKLNLTIDEYVFADFIKKHQDDRDTRITYGEVFKETGIRPSEIPDIFKSLKQKKVLYRHENGIVTTTPLWDDHFHRNDNFDKFWELNKLGNRSKAMNQFDKAIKIIPFEQLLGKYKEYLKWCEDTGTYRMHAATWLNPKYKNWENYLDNTYYKRYEENKKKDNANKTTLDEEF